MTNKIGAQPGNSNAVKNRPISEQIMAALHSEVTINGTTTRKMRILAERLVDRAIGLQDGELVNGDMTAAKMVLDRTEGSVAQILEVGGDHKLIINVVEMPRALPEPGDNVVVIDNEPVSNDINGLDDDSA